MHRKVLVGLSGGVDSAVAAWLLKEEGYDVTCGFMRNWDSLANDDFNGNPTLNEPVCPQEQDYNDAAAAAQKLGLPLLRVDFIKEYWDDVFSVFLSEYRKGRTPNPDILCNRHIKFDSFLEYAKEKGFDTLATGHYAAIGHEGDTPVLKKAKDRNKDQSYFLAEIRRETLSSILFPLADLEKPQVRQIAEELRLSIAEKKDSTGICFIGERDFRRFLSNYLPMKEGDIIDIETGKKVGRHKGVLYYTTGQRKGLDIGGIGPFYVVGKDVGNNELYVVDEGHQDLLYSDACIVDHVNILADREYPLACAAKFRYRQKDNDVTVSFNDDGTLLVRYPQTVRSVTPGQECVIYDGDTVIMGGRIETVLSRGQDIASLLKQKRGGYGR